MNKNKALVLVTLFPLAWILYLTQNTPFSTMDDPTIHYLAKTSSYGKILSRVLNPLTPAWTYQFQAMGGEQNSLGLRPVELFIWKTAQNAFGYSPAAFYFIKALFLSLVAAFIFVVARRLTQNTLMATLASLFYATTLSAYNSVTVITAFDILAQFFQGLAALLFLSLYQKNLTKNPSMGETAQTCVALYLMIWLSIKTYETTKIMPLIFAAFVGLRHWRRPLAWLQNRNNLLLFFTIMLMAILVVPFTGSYKVYSPTGALVDNQASLAYHWDTLYRFALQNTRNAWESEKSIAFFSLKSDLPFSLARTFGFFLCWIAVFSAVAAMRPKSKVWQWDHSRRSLFIFIIVWVLADLAALGLPKESDGRHLMAPLIPLTLLVTACIGTAMASLRAPFNKIFAGICLLGWGFAFFTNVGHNVYFRKFLGGAQIAQDKYLSWIYKDIYGAEPSYEDLTRFMLVPEELCVWHIPVIVDDSYGSFHEKSKPGHLTQVHAKHGHAYVVTTDPGQFHSDARYRKVGEFSETTDSLFTRTALKMKKKKPAVHTVFKFQPSA